MGREGSLTVKEKDKMKSVTRGVLDLEMPYRDG